MFRSFPRTRESRATSAGVRDPWIPAFAGMSGIDVDAIPPERAVVGDAVGFAQSGKNLSVRPAWFNEISSCPVRNMTLRSSILLVLVLFGNSLAVAQPGKVEEKS